MDEGGPTGLFELLSQVAYIDIYDIARSGGVEFVEVLPYIAAGDGLACADGEVFEKCVFSGCQGDLVFAAADLAGCQVDLEVFYLDFRRLSAIAAADEGADAREELFECEGLDEIVVGAEVEACDAVF